MLQPGDILSGYRVESILGRGGMGVVYRARQLSMERSVALKVLSAEHLADQAFRERFRREGRVASQLDHPNIIPVFEAGEADGHLFIVMRLVDGPTMGELIAEQGALRWQRVLEILAPIASALDAAGSAGLVHRDVKPQNILIASSGHPYLADFGLMRMARTTEVTLTGEWLGSPDYAAPEHMTDAYTSAGDVYSLTTVAFHALTGRLPYNRTSDLAVLHAHATAPPPRITELNPDLPARLDEVIAWGMAKTPAERPPSASILIEELAIALRSASLDAVLIKEEIGESSADDRSDVEREQRRRPVTDALDGVPAGGPERTATSSVDLPEDHDARRRLSARPTVVEAARLAPPIPDAPAVAAARRAWAGILAAVALFVAVFAGAMALTPRERQSSDGQRVQRASFALVLPGGFQRRADARIGSLVLSDRVTATTAPAITLEAGHLDRPRSGPDPLPLAHTTQWVRALKPEHVSLGAVQALRYDAGIVGGELNERSYVVPTTNGYVLMVCRGPRLSLGKLRRSCDRVATSLRIRGATALRPGPSPATASRLMRALDDLEHARREQRRALASTRNETQAAAARSLAAAHASAALQIGRLSRGPQDRGAISALERAVKSLSTDLTDLASAASSSGSAEYLVTQRRIAVDEKRLRSALRKLRDAGYSVRFAAS